MRTRQIVASVLAAALATAPLAGCNTVGRDPEGPEPGPRARVEPAKPAPDRSAPPTIAVDAKPLTDTVRKGLLWLASHQLASGGWGQGDEAPGMGHGMARQRDLANVADTSMALLAFVRAGHTPTRGEHRDVVRRGLEYVLAEVEAADQESLYVTSVRGTRVQGKIGPYADTFAALMILTEAKGTMRDGVANARIDRALRKVVTKLERNQRENGTWDDRGWAPVLSQAMAAKGVNRAAQVGVDVDDRVLERVEVQAAPPAGGFAAGGTAGVELYGAAASTSASRDSARTKKDKAEKMKEKAAKPRRRSGGAESPDAPTAAEIAAAEASADVSDRKARQVEKAMVQRLGDDRFIAGFGNNGGEEFLSYMLISETLLATGGDDWNRWDREITKLVNGVQNEDGSWTGHHCITGRTFCTATALLVLLADRAPASSQVARIAK